LLADGFQFLTQPPLITVQYNLTPEGSPLQMCSRLRLCLRTLIQSQVWRREERESNRVVLRIHSL
jgi:hypothetical protein